MGRACPDDTADRLLGLGQAGLLAVPGPGAYLGWMMVSLMSPTVSTPGLALGASSSSKGDPTRPSPSGGQEEEEEDQGACRQAQPCQAWAARTRLLSHTILMQLMVRVEIDSHQTHMDLSSPLFSLIIPPPGGIDS